MLDIARAAGVSRSTVSNVMRDADSVNESLRARVLEWADRLGYVYDRGAANLRTRQSGLIGLVIPDLANPYITETVRGVSAVVSEHGFLVTTIETADDAARQAVVLRSLAEHRTDGLILLGALGTNPVTLSATTGNMPTVLLQRGLDAPGFDQVGGDQAATGRTGARHLISDHGCRSIGYFGGLALAPPRRERLAAVRTFARRAKVAVDSAWSTGCDPTPQDAYDLARRLLAAGPPPEGLYCHGDRTAYGLLRALREAGIATERCRVMGSEDLPDSRFQNPSLTSVDVYPGMIGRVAAQRLLQRLSVDVSVETVPLPTLRRRESCGCVSS